MTLFFGIIIDHTSVHVKQFGGNSEKFEIITLKINFSRYTAFSLGR